MDGEVAIPAGDVTLQASFTHPDDARGVVAFAHGSGSGRHSPRNRYVADVLNAGGFATVLADLLTGDEERVDMRTRHLRFDIELLAQNARQSQQVLTFRRQSRDAFADHQVDTVRDTNLCERRRLPTSIST